MSVHDDDRRRTDAAVRRARSCFLESDSAYGCAEAALVALRECYGLPEAADSSAAIALNGGYAYSGGTCGALSGAGLAVGQLAERRLGDHRLAKTMTRSVVQALLDDFADEFGSADCRDLIGMDLRAPGAHDAFIASGVWRDGCMRQIEFVVRRLAPLSPMSAWRQRVGAAAHRSADQPDRPGDPVAGREQAR
jgi:C_GCAxxG_C_C family probable redox protein